MKNVKLKVKKIILKLKNKKYFVNIAGQYIKSFIKKGSKAKDQFNIGVCENCKKNQNLIEQDIICFCCLEFITVKKIKNVSWAKNIKYSKCNKCKENEKLIIELNKKRKIYSKKEKKYRQRIEKEQKNQNLEKIKIEKNQQKIDKLNNDKLIYRKKLLEQIKIDKEQWIEKTKKINHLELLNQLKINQLKQLKINKEQKSEKKRIKQILNLEKILKIKSFNKEEKEKLNNEIELEKSAWTIRMFQEYEKEINRRKEISERLKQNNPMKKEEVIKKCQETFKYRIENGILNYKRGKEHHLYKGNRQFNKACRDKLYDCWIYPILLRDNFKCTKCNNNKNLQVHHIKPLRDIITLVLNKNNINFKSSNFTKEDYENFDDLVQEVLNEHTLDDGITVCKICHEKIDYMYRVYKNKSKTKEN